METIWRPVKGYEGLYEVSNTGLVRSLGMYAKGAHGCQRFIAGRVLSRSKIKNGYLVVSLYKNGSCKKEYVHRLVAQTFPEICGEWFEGCDVNHKNEVKTDNQADNLETCNRNYNLNYGDHNRKMQDTLTSRYGKPVVAFDSNGRLICTFESARSAVRKYGKGVQEVLKGRAKTAYGYTFKYYDDIE